MAEFYLRFDMENITRANLVKKISGSIGLSEAMCDEVVNQIFLSIFEIAKHKGRIHIKNFGSFCVASKNERPGRDISKNLEVKIESKKIFRFSSSRNLRFAVNNNGL